MVSISGVNDQAEVTISTAFSYRLLDMREIMRFK
jgi:hypothetical protein